MNVARVVVCVLASVPAAWFVGTLRERVLAREPLFRPLRPLVPRGSQTITQVITTALFVLAAVRFADDQALVLAGYLLFFSAAVALSLIDLDTKRLPDVITAVTLMVGIPLVTLASFVARDTDRIRYAVLGGLVYFGFLLLTHLAFPRGMGFGDVKLAALMGFFVGWVATSGLTAVVLVLYAMIVGFLAGSAAGIVLFAFYRKSRAYPFGPFLIAGAVVAIVASPQLIPVGSI